MTESEMEINEMEVSEVEIEEAEETVDNNWIAT